MTTTRTIVLGVRKFPVAMDARNLGRMTRRNFTVVQMGHGHHARRQLEQTWFMTTAHFLMACFMYGLVAYSFVRYIFSVLHMVDGLIHVDSIMRERLSEVTSVVDWAFFAPVGLITICLEMYAMILTFLMMIRQYDAIAKLTGNETWDQFMAMVSVFLTCACLSLMLFFFYFATAYHYAIIHKVLSLSPYADATLAIFQNSTADLIRPENVIFF